MKRPLFLLLIGLVSGEAAAILLNRNGFFVMALFLFIYIICSILLYEILKKKRSHFFIYIVLFWFFFILGIFLFLQADYQNKDIDILLSEESVKGILTGEVEFVKQTAKGEYQITIKKPKFQLDNAKRRKTNKKQCVKTIALKKKCRILKVPISEGKIYPGDKIQCTGKLSAIKKPTNPGEFHSKIYYYSLGISYQFFGEKISRKEEQLLSIFRLAGDLRNQIDFVYQKVLSKKEYGLMKAILLGDKTDLLKEQKDLYIENGVAHLLAVSGLHISMIGGLLFRFLRKRGSSYVVSCIFGSSVLIFYAIMTGLGNSVFRAVIMFLVFLTAQYFGAEYDLVSSMSLAGILMFIECPWRLLDNGCIISFVSVFSIGIILPYVKELEEKRGRENLTKGELILDGKWKTKWKQAFLANFILSMIIMPLLLRFYYQWSPYSILLNLFVIPAMSPLLLSAIIGGLFGIYNQMAAFFACIPAVILLKSFDGLFRVVKKFPYAVIITGCPPWRIILFLYLIELLFCVFWYYRQWCSSAICILLLIAGHFFRPMEPLKVAMLDVGQGECILLKMPTGEAMLIDGGSTTKQKIAEYTILPALKYYGIDCLDYVIMTHTDEDHVSGIRELLEENYPIKNIILPNREKIQNSKQQKLKKDSHILQMRKDDQIQLGKVCFLCLHPQKDWTDDDANSGSLVLYLQYEKFTMLFTGDLNGEQEPLLEEKGERNCLRSINILKVAHHGSKNSTTKNFLKKCRPEKAIISAGKNNRYGHPHKESLQRLRESGTDTYGTLWGGAILITSNGQQYKIKYFGEK